MPKNKSFIYLHLFHQAMKIGGQAVIEGVMMRNKEKFAIAVRLPNGKIKVHKQHSTHFPRMFNIFFIRGIANLVYMLRDGLKALIWSSNQQLGKEEKITRKEIVFTLLLSFLLVILFFVIVPFFTARLVRSEGLWFELLDGGIRVALFLGYLALISRMQDVQRIFQYHGAEHKTIYCYEAGRKITPAEIKKFAKEHHRCGTSFLFMVLILSILVFSLLSGPWWVKLGGRILLVPVIAGIAYELIKLGDKYHRSRFVQFLLAPGMWLQKITTKEPTEKQIEVAMKALKAVVK